METFTSNKQAAYIVSVAEVANVDESSVEILSFENINTRRRRELLQDSYAALRVTTRILVKEEVLSDSSTDSTSSTSPSSTVSLTTSLVATAISDAVRSGSFVSTLNDKGLKEISMSGISTLSVDGVDSESVRNMPLYTAGNQSHERTSSSIVVAETDLQQTPPSSVMSSPDTALLGSSLQSAFLRRFGVSDSYDSGDDASSLILLLGAIGLGLVILLALALFLAHRRSMLAKVVPLAVTDPEAGATTWAGLVGRFDRRKQKDTPTSAKTTNRSSVSIDRPIKVRVDGKAIEVTSVRVKSREAPSPSILP